MCRSVCSGTVCVLRAGASLQQRGSSLDVRDGETETDRETETERQRQTERQRDRDRERQRQTHRER